MNAQTPAEGILKMTSYTGWRQYRVPCECGCENQVGILFEIDDPTDKLITCHISSTVKTDYWSEFWPITYKEHWVILGLKTVVNTIVTRVKLICDVVAHGYIKMESYTLLTEQQALNMSATIQIAINDLRNENTGV